MVTAARDVENVRAALAGGATHIDRVYGVLRRSSAGSSLPKGISRPTLQLVVDALRSHPDGATASELEADLDISRATAQRYLTFLAEVGRAELTPRYRDQGRPVHVYRSS